MDPKPKSHAFRRRVTVLCGLGLFLLAIQQPILWEWFLDLSLQKVEEKTGWQIVAGRVTIRPLAGAFHLEQPAVHGTDGELLLSAESFEGDFSLWSSLWSRAWVFDTIRIDAPRAVFKIQKNAQMSPLAFSESVLEEIPTIQTKELAIDEGTGIVEVLGDAQNEWRIEGVHLALEGEGDSEQLTGDVNFRSLMQLTPDDVRRYEGKPGIVEMDVANWIHPDEIRLKGFEVQGEEGTAKVSGTLALLPGWVPNYQVTIQTTAELDDIFSQPPMTAPISGKANLELTWLGEANNPPKLKGKSLVKSLEVADRKIGTLDIDYSGDLKNILIQEGSLIAGDGRVSLVGNVSLAAPYPFSIDAMTDAVSLYQVLGDAGLTNAWVDLKANLHVSGQGKLLPSFSFEGQAEGELRARGLFFRCENGGPRKKSVVCSPLAFEQ